MLKTTIIAGLLALLAAGPAAAAGQSPGPTPAPPGPAVPNSATPNPAADAADPYTALARAKVSMAQAIEKAESTAAGKVLDIRFDDGGRLPAYRADLFKDKGILEIGIDAATGAVIESRHIGPEDLPLDDEQKAEVDLVRKAKVSLAQAVATAEKAGNAKAVDAGLDLSEDKPVYAVDVAAAGKVRHITLDMTTGAVIAVSDVEGGMDEDAD